MATVARTPPGAGAFSPRNFYYSHNNQTGTCRRNSGLRLHIDLASRSIERGACLSLTDPQLLVQGSVARNMLWRGPVAGCVRLLVCKVLKLVACQCHSTQDGSGQRNCGDCAPNSGHIGCGPPGQPCRHRLAGTPGCVPSAHVLVFSSRAVLCKQTLAKALVHDVLPPIE